MNPAPRSAPPSAVSPASIDFANGFVTADEHFQRARAHAEALELTPISNGVCATLTLLSRAIKASTTVEIGTGTGLSALALLAGMAPDGTLTSIDVEAGNQMVAREVLTGAGIPTRRARLIAGQPLDVLPKLTDGAYDLVLVNGDPLEYVEYVALGEQLLRPGGLLILHHALWQGMVADERNDEDEPLIIREALAAVQENPAFTPALLPVGDGLLVAVRN